MTEMTFDLDRLEIVARVLRAGNGNVLSEPDREQLLSLARRALESESRHQSQGVPTVTREHREAATEALNGDKCKTWDDSSFIAGTLPEPKSAWRVNERVAQLLATREAAAHERGRSQAAGDGANWKRLTEEAPEAGTFAWIVWEGTLQEQPWEWAELDEDGHMGWVHGESEITDGVDLYLPLRLPAPPSDSGKGGVDGQT